MLSVAGAVTVMLPAGVLFGNRMSISVLMNSKSLGEAAQINGVLAPGVPLTRVKFRANKVPEPESGVFPSLEKAETRSVLIGPPPGRTLAATVQLSEVSPAPETAGIWKVTTVWSKVKSP
jgi:hypothetical protein